MALTPGEENKLREEIRKELERREIELKENREQKEEEQQRKLEKQLREKIREEEEEKYFTERGYTRYTNHQGLVEWLTQEEAEQRKKRRRSKRGSSRHKKHQEKRTIHIVSNIGIIFVAGMILLFLYKFNLSGGSSYGSITINSDVPGCKIFLDGIEVNSFTPHTLNKVSAGIHFVSVYKEGFSAWPPMTSVSVSKNKTIFADFTLEHSTFLGEIIIESNLADYDLYIDGLHFETTGARLQIPIGYHIIAIVKAGYLAAPSYQRVLVERNGLKTLRFELNPEESIGYLQISSNRKNEYIYLDGRFTGIKAQGKPLPVKAGTYEVSTRENGYLTTPETRILNLLPDEKKLVVFHSIPVSDRNSVNITTTLPGAAITLNGDWTSFVTPARNLELSPGSHYLNLMRGESIYSAKDILIDTAQLKNNNVKIDF